ncbi:MAG: O-antigen ligase family protein [Eubacteriales bacterium]
MGPSNEKLSAVSREVCLCPKEFESGLRESYMGNDHLKLSKNSVIAVCLYILQFVGMPYTPWYNYVKYGLIIVIGIYILKRVRVLFQKKYNVLNLMAIAFTALVIFSSYVNRNRVSGRNILLASIIFGAIFLEAFFTLEILTEQGSIKKTLRLFRNCAIVEICICDALMLLLPDVFWIEGIDCLIGSKFGVMYAHLWTIMFVLICRFINQKKWFDLRMALIFIWTGFISIQVDCVTGFVGLVFLFLIMLLINKFRKQMINPVAVTVLLVACFLFVFGYDFVLSNPTVNHLIVDVFNRQGTMNSRLSIFEMTLTYLKGHWLLGVGYGSSYELGMAYGNFADTQNSILEWIWQAGIPATLIMVLLIIFIFTRIARIHSGTESKYGYPVVALIYVYLLLGSVEIMMNNTFFALCAVGFAVAENIRLENKNQISD